MPENITFRVTIYINNVTSPKKQGMLVQEYPTWGGGETNYINNIKFQRTGHVSARKSYFRRSNYINNVTSQRAGDVSV